MAAARRVSYVTGYTTTADYTGEVYRTGVTVIRYTVIFTGTPIEPEVPETAAGTRKQSQLADGSSPCIGCSRRWHGWNLFHHETEGAQNV